jgi:hypothetical protein
VSPPPVEYLDAEPSGLAAMIGGLIEGNLAAHPDRVALLKPAVVGIVATDAGVAITVRLSRSRITVADGLLGRPQLVVEADSETLTELTSSPLRLGFPDAMTPEGREVTGKLLRRDLRVRGLVRHPAIVSRLNRLLSVA